MEIEGTVFEEILYKRCEEITNASEKYLELVEKSYKSYNRFIDSLTADQREKYTDFEKDLFKIQNFGEVLIYTQGINEGREGSGYLVNTAQNTAQNIIKHNNDVSEVNNELINETKLRKI